MNRRSPFVRPNTALPPTALPPYRPSPRSSDAPPNYDEIEVSDRQIRSATSNIIKLDIGGTIFKTSKSTLTKFNGLLKMMMDRDGLVTRDESGVIFIDRSAKHFDKILNFMRDGQVALPDSIELLEEIYREATYYMLDRLMMMCNKELTQKAKEKCRKEEKEMKNEKLFEGNVKVIDSDNQFLQITTQSEKPVLVIHYHVDKDGLSVLPKDFEINDFVERHNGEMDIYFKPFVNITFCASSRCDADVSWHWSLHVRDGPYLYKEPEFNCKGNLKWGEGFEVQLEKSIEDFFTNYVED